MKSASWHVGSIQGETSSAIATMEQGRQLMQDGLERNAKVAAALAQISEQSEAAGEQFASITTATSEQSSTATVLSANLQSIRPGQWRAARSRR
jgi:methyl-accepting chemotaxis protein